MGDLRRPRHIVGPAPGWSRSSVTHTFLHWKTDRPWLPFLVDHKIQTHASRPRDLFFWRADTFPLLNLGPLSSRQLISFFSPYTTQSSHATTTSFATLSPICCLPSVRPLCPMRSGWIGKTRQREIYCERTHWERPRCHDVDGLEGSVT